MSTETKAWLVEHWMSRHIYSVRPGDPLVDAFELMREHRIRHVPVLERGKLVGIVSDRDIRLALPLRAHTEAASHNGYGRALMGTQVEKVMTRKPITIDEDASIREAAELLCREKISALPVMKDKTLTGIITSEDLLWAFVDNYKDVEIEF